MKTLCIILLSLFCSATGYADALPVKVVDAGGSPVENAIITLERSDGESKIAPDADTENYRMSQRNLQFRPFVLVVPVGAEVEFPNLDRVRHHVYSFSKGNRFQLKLYGREEARFVTFENAGVAAIGCNIHDDMLAFIKVTDAVVVGKTDALGQVELEMSNGEGRIKIWHPFIKGNEIEVDLSQQVAGEEMVISIEITDPSQ